MQAARATLQAAAQTGIVFEEPRRRRGSSSLGAESPGGRPGRPDSAGRQRPPGWVTLTGTLEIAPGLEPAGAGRERWKRASLG
jgi:hypothetical protein